MGAQRSEQKQGGLICLTVDGKSMLTVKYLGEKKVIALLICFADAWVIFLFVCFL